MSLPLLSAWGLSWVPVTDVKRPERHQSGVMVGVKGERMKKLKAWRKLGRGKGWVRKQLPPTPEQPRLVAGSDQR